MIKAKLEEISVDTENLSKAATGFLEYLIAVGEEGSPNYDVAKIIHGTDVSYSDCVSRLSIMAELANKFGASKHYLMVPAIRISILKQNIDEAQRHLNSLENQFRQVVQIGGGIRSFNYENFHLQANNGQNNDLRGYFKNFNDSVEALLDPFMAVLAILRPSRSTYSFQAAANALTVLIDKSNEQLQALFQENASLRQAASDAQQLVAIAEAQADSAKDSADEALRTKEEGAKDRKTIAEYLADATDKRAAIEATYSEASSLKNEIHEYQEKFKSFDRQLENRNNDFEIGKERQESLFARYLGQKQAIDKIINKSEDMLKGATVAGLASSFSQAKEKLDTQLHWARFSFYVGISFLFISAMPLMLYVFLPVITPFLQARYPEFANFAPTLEMQGDMSGWQYVGQVLARFIILLPAAWLVSFAAIRHSSLFRLREHYAYKYSMAVSVEGFQKQAVGYESEIAALVLEQLAFNPADKLVLSKEAGEGKVPHPLLNILVEKFRTGMSKND